MNTYRIIENQYEDKYDEFVEEYNKGTSLQDIYDKLDLSNYMYKKYRRIALERGDIKDRRSSNAKYYYELRGKYMVSKRNHITNKMIYYGVYETEGEAKEKVELLKKNNWEEEECD